MPVDSFSVTGCVRNPNFCSLQLSLRYAAPTEFPSTLTFKRSEKSVESRFFKKCTARLCDAGVRLPKIFYNLSGDGDASASSILLMEDLSAARRCTDSLDDLKLAINYLARFHRATLGDETFLKELAAGGGRLPKSKDGW